MHPKNAKPCERCGQPGTRQNPTFAYFAEVKYLHTSCFEEYAEEVLKETK